MSVRYVVLGLLAKQAMTGYDVRSLFQSLNWLVESPSYGSLYPTLHSLLDKGWVTVDIVPNEGKPPKKVYHITAAGEQALHQWLSEPVTQEFSTKAFIMRLVLASNLSSDQLRDHLARRRSQVMTYLSNMDHEGAVDEIQELQDVGQHLVHGYGIAVAKAELAWLESQLTQLSQNT